MGLLDSMFGSGQGGQAPQQQQGPAPDTMWDRFRAEYAPGAYGAHQQSLQQQAVYSAMLQNGATPENAQAMAMNPQFFQMGAPANMPTAPEKTVLTDAQGNQTLGQIQNKGGPAGHGFSGFSGIPIVQPGTTPSAPQAAGATSQPQGAQGDGLPPVISEQAQQDLGYKPPTDTLQGIPGNTTELTKKVAAAVQSGQDPYAAMKGTPYANSVKAVIDGKMTLSEIKQTRNEHLAGTVRNLVLTIDPNYNELKGEKTAAWVKSYMDTKNGDVGMSRNALGTSLNHISTAIDNQLGLDNRDANVAVGASLANRARGMVGEQAPKVAAQNTHLGVSADEFAKFITGKPPTDQSRGQAREEFPTPFDTPRVAAGKYDAMANLIEGRLKDMEIV